MDTACYYRVSVKGIVIADDGRILLSHQEDGRWDMLGGGLEHGEDPVAGLRREIFEETGLRITSVSACPKYLVTAPRRRANPKTYIANVIYEIKLEHLNFVPSDECQELKFFNKMEMEQLDSVPCVQKLAALL